MNTPLNLTFGVEFELIVRWSHTAYRLQLIEEEEKFSSGPLESIPKDFLKENIRTTLAAAKYPINPVYFNGDMVPNSYASWTIKDDLSINTNEDILDGEPQDTDELYIGVELTSRILPATGAGLGEVLEVLELLERSFSIKVNDTCGFHVHVGNRNNGFPTSTVRRLAQLVTAFEHQIESIHPPSRIDNDYCASPSSIMLQDHESQLEGVRMLSQECSSTKDICWLFSPIKGSAYNINNLCNVRSTHTIEFRQHAGTANGLAALSWAVLCTELVRFCHSVPQTWFDGLLVTYGTDDSFGIRDLITAVVRDGGDDLRRFYGEERLFKRDRRVVKELWMEVSLVEESEQWEILGDEEADRSDFEWV